MQIRLKDRLYLWALLALTALGLAFTLPVRGQFYNGHQMAFGKNRVQYNEFLWQFYRHDRFDVYYYVNGRELAEFTAQVADEEIKSIGSYFQYTLQNRIIFLIYNTLSEFRQSNIGLVSGNEQTNIGGVTKIMGNKVFLYFEGDRSLFRKQVRAAIAEVLLGEMLFGTNFRERLTNSTLIALPDWYLQGLISFVADNWNREIEDKVKDGIQSGKYARFNRLSGEDAVLAGHSIWRYISDLYGPAIIPNIIYLTRIHKNPEDGILYVLGISFPELSSQWLDYYHLMYEGSESKKESTSQAVIRRPKAGQVVRQARISPGGSYIAYTTNQSGRYRIFLYDTKTRKSRLVYKREHPLEQITDYSYPLLAWHPNGKILSFITEEKGKILFHLYPLEEKKLDSRQLFNVDKVLDYSYADNGLSVVMSAVVKGQSDIFIHSLVAYTYDRITNDPADDLQPRFLANSTQLIFSSNRNNDTLGGTEGIPRPGQSTDLFIYDLKERPRVLTRLTHTPWTSEFQPQETGFQRFAFLSDESGIVARHGAVFDSSIALIDTSIHFRYFARSYPLTDYPRSIMEFDQTRDGQLIELFRKNQRQNIYLSQTPRETPPGMPVNPVYFRQKQVSEWIRTDSIQKTPKAILPPPIPVEPVITLPPDTLVDIFNYQFESEKKPLRTTPPPQTGDPATASPKKEPVRPRMYFTSFYQNYLVTQVDFSSLNLSYQAFTGGQFYFNPGMNLFFLVGSNDLFEDYKITGGYRVTGGSNEQILSVENLKQRLDRQWIYNRRVYTNNYTTSSVKVTTQEGQYILRYPFSQVSALKGTFSLRYDREVFLSTDLSNLREPNLHKYWSGIKLEYIFDNTISQGINLYKGTRFKVFGESYFEVNKEYNDLYVVGADFRHYEKIHREIIWASRLAASTSFGRSRLIYYLGSVDNWYNFSTTTPTFDDKIKIDQSQTYAYQAVATNMRGFSQNIRNGNSFVLLNNEIRIPLIRYFARKPINSDFLANLQVIAFGDIGTAWAGSSPWARSNAFNYEYYQNGPITVIINRNIEPIVAGYGWGLRTRLLGYFIRADWAWGIEDYVVQPRIFYLSLSLDF